MANDFQIASVRTFPNPGIFKSNLPGVTPPFLPSAFGRDAFNNKVEDGKAIVEDGKAIVAAPKANRMGLSVGLYAGAGLALVGAAALAFTTASVAVPLAICGGALLLVGNLVSR